MNLWDTFTEAMRSRFTFDQDPCKLYNEQVLVDPIYEVPPTKVSMLFTLQYRVNKKLQQCKEYFFKFKSVLPV